MEAGIVGLPNVGKSTLFNALTMSKAAQSANYPFCTIEPNEGIVSVPDDRLRKISQYIVPKKLVHAALKLVDMFSYPTIHSLANHLAKSAVDDSGKLAGADRGAKRRAQQAARLERRTASVS